MIKVTDVEKSYQSAHVFKRRRTPIVKGVSFECPIGATIAIIGESGSGKSTLSRMILGIEKPDKGCVTLNDLPMHKKKVRRHQIGAVFQDYTSSLHPFQTVREILFEVMCQCDGQPKEVMEVQAITLLEEVGLSKAYMDKYPNMLSGGEAQRVAIARAICINPKYILFDEAISSLDMSIQTQILDLLIHLRETRQLSYIFITHDIQAATYLCDQLIIFKNGKIEEQIPTSALHKSDNAYTRELIEKQLSFLRSEIMKGAMAWPFLRLYILTLMFFSANAILNVFIPLRGHDLGATNTVIGIVMGAYMLTAMVFRPWAGQIIARVGPIKVLRIILIINAIALIIYGFTGLEGYFVARVMQGVCTAFFSMSLQLGIIDALPEEHRSEGVSLYSLFSTIPNLIGPLVAVGIWNANNISLFAIVIIFIALTTTFFGYRVTFAEQEPDMSDKIEKMPFNAVTVFAQFFKIKSC